MLEYLPENNCAKFYQDFIKGKVATEIKVLVKTVDGKDYTQPVSPSEEKGIWKAYEKRLKSRKSRHGRKRFRNRKRRDRSA